jgi:hypothetical protein
MVRFWEAQSPCRDSWASGVSADGSVIVGTHYTSSGPEACLFRTAGPLVYGVDREVRVNHSNVAEREIPCGQKSQTALKFLVSLDLNRQSMLNVGRLESSMYS